MGTSADGAAHLKAQQAQLAAAQDRVNALLETQRRLSNLLTTGDGDVSPPPQRPSAAARQSSEVGAAVGGWGAYVSPAKPAPSGADGADDAGVAERKRLRGLLGESVRNCSAMQSENDALREQLRQAQSRADAALSAEKRALKEAKAAKEEAERLEAVRTWSPHRTVPLSLALT